MSKQKRPAKGPRSSKPLVISVVALIVAALCASLLPNRKPSPPAAPAANQTNSVASTPSTADTNSSAASAAPGSTNAPAGAAEADTDIDKAVIHIQHGNELFAAQKFNE